MGKHGEFIGEVKKMFVIRDTYLSNLYFRHCGDEPVYWTFDKKQANQFETPASAGLAIHKYGGIVVEVS
jgi:hypothetical protein